MMTSRCEVDSCNYQHNIRMFGPLTVLTTVLVMAHGLHQNTFVIRFYQAIEDRYGLKKVRSIG